MKAIHTLGEKERLKSRKSIGLLFQQGRKLSLPPLRAVYLSVPAAEGLRIGVSVSTRQFSRAVDRNRVKRLIREAWRLQKNELQGLLREKQRGLHVFILYTARELPDFQSIYGRTGQLIRKLTPLIHEDPAPHT